MNWTVEQLQQVLKQNPALRVRGPDLEGLQEERGVILKPTVKGGWREDLQKYFRSSWEANVARYYNFLGVQWEYEPREFTFPVKRGCTTYKPDFWLSDLCKWVEVKGYMDSKSRTKLKRFEKYYPEEYAKLELITAEEYKEIVKYKGLIHGWEG